jgi:hypothetical protein
MDCGGASICTHQRRRSRCKECGGASIFPHQRQRADARSAFLPFKGTSTSSK